MRLISCLSAMVAILRSVGAAFADTPQRVGGLRTGSPRPEGPPQGRSFGKTVKEKPPKELPPWAAMSYWWRCTDSNRGHVDYDSTALTN